jgi:hypothetical protein
LFGAADKPMRHILSPVFALAGFFIGHLRDDLRGFLSVGSVASPGS